MENESIDIEQQARAQGWVPVEEFRGGPEKHKTAEEFIEFGKKSQAVQKERNDKLLNEITALKTQVGSYQETVNSFRTTHEKEMAAVKLDAYNRAKAELTAERKQAIREADEDRVEELDEKINNLKEPAQPTETIKEGPKPDPEFITWVAENPWFETDKTMNEYAEFVAEKISRDGVTTKENFYSTILERVKKQFPAKFPGQKEEIQDVESSHTGRASASSVNVKGYKDLPTDAKTACDRYIKQGLYKTREEYVKVYNAY